MQPHYFVMPLIRTFSFVLLAGCFILLGCRTASVDPAGAAAQIDEDSLSPDARKLYYSLMLTDSLSTQDNTAALRALQGLLGVEPSLAAYQDAGSLLLMNREFSAAEQLLSEGVRQYPDDPMLVQLISAVYSEEGDDAQAIAFLQKYAARNKKNIDITQELLRLFIKNGKIAEASAILPHLPLYATPQSPYIHARVYAGLGHYAKALRVLQTQAKKFPHDPDVWVELAFLEEGQERPAQALKYYEKAQSASPQNMEITLRIITLCLQNKMLGKALQAYNTAPSSIWLTLQTSLLFAEAGNLTEAESLLQAEAQHPDAPADVFLQLAAVHMDRTGNVAESLAFLDKISKDNPSYEFTLERKIRILLFDGKFDQAFAVAEEALTSYPQNIIFWELGAYSLTGKKDFVAARKFLTETLKAFPGNPDILFTLATVEDTDGNKEKALSLMENIVQSFPHYAKALNYVGYTLADAGQDLERAYSLLVTAASEEPNADYIIDSLAWALYRLGKYEEAWEKIQQCIKLGADDPTIWEHYGDIASKLNKLSEAQKGYATALEKHPVNEAQIQRKLDALLH